MLCNSLTDTRFYTIEKLYIRHYSVWSFAGSQFEKKTTYLLFC